MPSYYTFAEPCISWLCVKRAHMVQPTYPAATDFGRQLVNGKLVATMMLKEAKPSELKHSKYCRCKKSMCARGCSCARANVKCGEVWCYVSAPGIPTDVQGLNLRLKTVTRGEGEGLSPEQYLQCATLQIIPPHRDLHLVN
ncbi:unnamed protein product [Boreogadus saida]